MKRPNILLLVAEDTGRSQGCYGDPVAHTPAIDGLAASGTLFRQAFSTAPVCAPSRSTLIMGRYAFEVGSHHMRSHLLQHPTLFTEILRQHGYFVNWSNKTDFNFTPSPSFADETEDWFDSLAAGKYRGKPWLLYHNFGVTHESSMWPENWEKNIAKELTAEERCDPSSVTVPAYLPDTPLVRADIARYYDSLTLQDRGVRRALDALQASGEADNTIVIYMADHGRGLAREKRWLYEAGIHLPLIIRWPGVTTAGTEDDQLVSWVDIAPTILSAAGIPKPDTYAGRVFLGPNADPKPRDYAFAGRDRMDEAFDLVRAARSKRYLYLRNFFPALPWAQRNQYMEIQQTTRELRRLNADGALTAEAALWMSPSKPPEELYDTERDPNCVNNLASNPEFTELLQQHREALESFLLQIGDKGIFSERELIEQGLVLDQRADYRERIAPLPPEWIIGPPQTILEAEDAVLWAQSLSAKPG